MEEVVTPPGSGRASEARADAAAGGVVGRVGGAAPVMRDPSPVRQPAPMVGALRRAGAAWAARPVRERVAAIGRARRLLARRAEALAGTVARPAADTLVAEVLPLLEAARFLERRAAGVLRTRRLRGGRPLWLLGTAAWVARRPLGAVLVLGPGNYPIFLPGAQVLQALAAGNAVAWKPAPGGEAAAAAVAAALGEAGVPAGVLEVLAAEAGPAAVQAGFDHILLTGSAETGAAVLGAAAGSLTPCTMELSGCDPVFVLPGADLRLVARCLAYAMRLNGGATCIAPRRVFVPAASAGALERALAPLLDGLTNAAPPEVAARLARLAAEAAGQGARLVGGGTGPLVVAEARPEMELLRQDVFAPWLALVPVADTEAALAAEAMCPYALGASIFGPPQAAQALAARLRAGSVCINDVIVPTADPRLPFGGSARSGFGATRGAEGLLALTRPVAISARRWFRPHLARAGAGDAVRFASLIRWLHG